MNKTDWNEFDDWFCNRYAETYKKAKDLLRTNIGTYVGELAWKKKVFKDLSDPNLYKEMVKNLGRSATLTENLHEALIRLNCDIEARRKLRDKGAFEGEWKLPIISSYVGENKKMYMQYLQSVSDNEKQETTQTDNSEFYKNLHDISRRKALFSLNGKLEKMGLDIMFGETVESHRERCRQWLEDNGYIDKDNRVNLKMFVKSERV